MQYAFGPFLLDISARTVRRNGATVALEPRIFDCLLHLIDHRDRVVPSEELLRAVWHDRQVSPASLTVAISELRRALSDSQPYSRIETVRGLGYRFVAEIESTESKLTSEARRHHATRQPMRFPRPELAPLRNRLSAPTNTSPSLFLIQGESGVGKTTALEECCDIAHSYGWATYAASCAHQDGLPPLWPWYHIVQLVAADPTMQCIKDDAPKALLDPNDFIDPPTHPWKFSSSSQPANRLRLSQSVATFLARAAELQPLCIAIDDLHQADEQAIEVFRFLFHSLGGAEALLVCARRQAGACANKSLRMVENAPGSERIELGNLSPTETHLFATSVFGVTYEPEIVFGLHKLTRGNPLLLSQIIPSLEAISAFDDLPADAKSAISSRFHQIEPEALRILRLGSVIGVQFRSDHLALLASMAPEMIEELLTQAAACDLVVHRSGFTWSFSHNLFRDWLYEDLPERARLSAHRGFTEVLLSDSDRLSRSDHSLLAHHCKKASAAQPLESDAITLFKEGTIALRENSYASAVDAANAALSIARRIAAQERLLTDILLLLGSAQARSGSRRAAVETFRDAARLAKRAGDFRSIATAALNAAPGLLSLEAGKLDESLLDLLRQALSYTSDCDIEIRPLLQARMSLALAWSEHGDEAQSLAAEATAATAGKAASAGRCLALASEWFATWSPSGLKQRIQLAESMIEAAYLASDRDAALTAEILLATATLEGCSFKRFKLACSRFSKMAREMQDPCALWYSELLQATTALSAGHFGEAELLAEAFRRRGDAADDVNAFHSYMAHSLVRNWARRDLEGFIPAAEQAVRAFPNLAAWRAGLAWAYQQIGLLIDARRHMRILLASGVEGIPHRTDWSFTIALASDVAVELDEPGWAEALYESLLPMRGTTIVLGLCVVSLGACDRYLGNLANFLGFWEAALDHYESALALDRAAGATTWTVRTSIELGDLLQNTGDPVRLRRGRMMGREALSSARGIGLHRYAVDS